MSIRALQDLNLVKVAETPVGSSWPSAHSSPPEFLSAFKGSPLLVEAIQLVESELGLEQQRQEEERQPRIYQKLDDIRISKNKLLLELFKEQALNKTAASTTREQRDETRRRHRKNELTSGAIMGGAAGGAVGTSLGALAGRTASDKIHLDHLRQVKAEVGAIESWARNVASNPNMSGEDKLRHLNRLKGQMERVVGRAAPKKEMFRAFAKPLAIGVPAGVALGAGLSALAVHQRHRAMGHQAGNPKLGAQHTGGDEHSDRFNTEVLKNWKPTETAEYKKLPWLSRNAEAVGAIGGALLAGPAAVVGAARGHIPPALAIGLVAPIAGAALGYGASRALQSKDTKRIKYEQNIQAANELERFILNRRKGRREPLNEHERSGRLDEEAYLMMTQDRRDHQTKALERLMGKTSAIGDGFDRVLETHRRGQELYDQLPEEEKREIAPNAMKGVGIGATGGALLGGATGVLLHKNRVEGLKAGLILGGTLGGGVGMLASRTPLVAPKTRIDGPEALEVLRRHKQASSTTEEGPETQRRRRKGAVQGAALGAALGGATGGTLAAIDRSIAGSKHPMAFPTKSRGRTAVLALAPAVTATLAGGLMGRQSGPSFGSEHGLPRDKTSSGPRERHIHMIE